MNLLREPLVHFLCLGAALFMLSSMIEEPESSSEDRIVVSSAQVSRMAHLFQKTWQRPPSEQELDGLVKDYIQEEVYYREALAMGLDRDDTIVRRRLRQKVEFIAESLGDAVDPTDSDLAQYLAENSDDYRTDPKIAFIHIYLNPDRHRQDLEAVTTSLLARLKADDPRELDPATLGDPLLLPNQFELTTSTELRNRFGERFTVALFETTGDEWAGPLASGFGVHLVRVSHRSDGELPNLEAIRAAVERDWRHENRNKASSDFYEALLARYSVEVEDGPEGDGENGTPAAAAAGISQ